MLVTTLYPPYAISHILTSILQTESSRKAFSCHEDENKDINQGSSVWIQVLANLNLRLAYFTHFYPEMEEFYLMAGRTLMN